jgi:hypothetical protein
MARSAAAPTPAESELLPGIYLLSDHMNQLLLDHLDPDAWRAKPPGSKTRTIVAIFTHMHNVRRKWVRLSAPPAEAPGAARPQPLHTKASQSGAGRECRPLCRDVERSVGRAGEALSSRRLGPALASECGHAGLYAFP